MVRLDFKQIGVEILALCILAFFGCNKFVKVPEPINSVTTGQVFSTDATAIAAILGIYSNMSGSEGQQSFSDYLTTFYLGESADELTDGDYVYNLYLINELTASFGNTLGSYFWVPAYYDIYNANAVISGAQASTGMSTGGKTELTGEAKFIRAFCYFYLTNIYGDLPLVLSVDFNQTVLLPRTSQAGIYQQIISDLQDAQRTLPSDFSLSGGQPIRANKWAATSLLARVYLYRQNWTGADSAASAVINSNQFRLVSLDSVFLANSAEAILQLQSQTINYPYATWEGYNFIPYDSTSSVTVWLTSQLLSAFEDSDQRRVNWVDSTDYNGQYYDYAFKYKVQVGNANAAPLENYTLLRFAEQYLIRAEADAHGGGGGIPQSIADLNVIRMRAGLPAYSGANDQQSILNAIMHENRIEFFAELGHRWLDLRRWGLAIQTLGAISYKAGNIDSTQLLYPIPPSEIQTDPNLTQNPGYH